MLCWREAKQSGQGSPLFLLMLGEVGGVWQRRANQSHIDTMDHICKTCGVSFYKNGTRHYSFCSVRCYGDSMSLAVEKKCENCGIIYAAAPRYRLKFCSRKCANAANPKIVRSPEWKAHISAGVKAAYKQGKMPHMRNQRPEEIAWRTRITPARAAASVLLGIKKRGVRVPPPANPKAAARLAENHYRPKRWIVRSEKNVIHSFINCRQWCKDNVHLFSDDRPESRTPLWLRASRGLSLVVNGRCCSWHGWVAVSVHELAEEHAIDLVGRPGDVPDKDELLRFRFPL